MQRYFPASRFVVLTTLNEAMNRRELVTFVSFRGASRTSMPCVNESSEDKKKQYQLSYQNTKTSDDVSLMLFPCRPWFNCLSSIGSCSRRTAGQETEILLRSTLSRLRDAKLCTEKSCF